MPRDLPIGNGSILVAFDKEYRLRELYFPHVGEENHTKGEPFRFGIWVDGQFEWLPGDWQITRDYLEESLVTHVELIHKDKELKIIANDLVDFHENLYLKKLTIENGADRPREIRLFFAHDFHLYGHEIGDTAVFYPENKTLVHYKAERHFLINVYAEGRYGIHTYATGNKVPGLFEGTWKDAEDGLLSGNPIAQGSVDSVASLSLKVGAKSQESCFYWICCGKNREEATAMNHLVQKRGPASFLTRTYNYWKCWVNKEPLNEKLLPPKVLRLYKRSLLIARSQINQCGSIIAANDSDVMQFNRDTYSYLWPRDGALVAHALDLAGYGSTSDFYRFCDRIIEKEGYFLHKYTPSGSVASSWHPWIKEGRPQLPIQEDETALVLWALWEHYKIFRDIEFIKPLYKNLIKRSADFLMNYRDPETGLPLPSYDLWEERQGILTFTAATVYGGLKAAAHFTETFGEHEIAKEYLAGAERLKEAMNRHLYLDDKKRFARMIRFLPDGSVEVDDTIDASLYGVFAFGAYPADDPRVKTTMEQVYATLWNTPNGGLARYAHDPFYRVDPQGIGNPWFVTTLWLAQYRIAIAKEKQDLAKALEILEWVADHALPSGVLAEQINPLTQEPLSVSPLTWSHGTYIIAVQQYLNKQLQYDLCPTCHQPKTPLH